MTFASRIAFSSRLFCSSWQRSYAIEPKESHDTVDSQQQKRLQDQSSPSNRSQPLKAYDI